MPSSICPFVGKLCNSIRHFCCSCFFDDINEKVKIERKAYFGVKNRIIIGNNSGFGENFHVQGADVEIGNFVMMGPNVTIIGRGHTFDSVDIPMIKQGITPKGKIIIEDDVWIGRGVTILPGCRHIGKGVIIGACSVVTKDVPQFEIWAGNPAHCIKKRV